jgi:hypothetical protein
LKVGAGAEKNSFGSATLATWPTSLRAAGSHESGVNCFSLHVMGLSEFHDTLPPVILHFGGDIGNGNLHHRPFAIFLILLKTFSGCGKRFRGIATMEDRRGQEKKIMSGLGGWKELKQKFFLKRERYKNIFNHETPPTPLAPDIHALQKSCIHTSYIHTDMHADIQTNRLIAIWT